MPALVNAIEAKYKRQWCGNIRGVYFISSLKRTGLDELRRAIVDTGSKLLWYVRAHMKTISESAEPFLLVLG